MGALDLSLDPGTPLAEQLTLIEQALEKGE